MRVQNGVPPDRVGDGQESPLHFFLFENPDPDGEYPGGRRVMFSNDLNGHEAAWDFLELQAREQNLRIERPIDIQVPTTSRGGRLRAAIRQFFAPDASQGHRKGARSMERTSRSSSSGVIVSPPRSAGNRSGSRRHAQSHSSDGHLGTEEWEKVDVDEEEEHQERRDE